MCTSVTVLLRHTHAGRGVFGVPLVTLVTSEGADVPKIIRRVVEHVDKYGKVEPLDLRTPLKLTFLIRAPFVSTRHVQ